MHALCTPTTAAGNASSVCDCAVTPFAYANGDDGKCHATPFTVAYTVFWAVDLVVVLVIFIWFSRVIHQELCRGRYKADTLGVTGILVLICAFASALFCATRIQQFLAQSPQSYDLSDVRTLTVPHSFALFRSTLTHTHTFTASPPSPQINKKTIFTARFSPF